MFFERLSFKDVIDKRESVDDFIAHNLSVSFYVDNQKYSFSSYYGYESSNKPVIQFKGQTEYKDFFDKIPDQYYQIFNKVLTDKFSSYKSHSFSVAKNSIGIIALTEKQTKEVIWTYDGALSSF